MRRWLIGGAALLLAGYLLMPFFIPSQAITGHAVSAGGQNKTEFAGDRAAAAAQEVAFDGKRAMGYLKDICAIGPRLSGTSGMTKQQKLIRDHFEKLGLKVQEQPFSAKQNSQKQAVAMTNLIVSVF